MLFNIHKMDSWSVLHFGFQLGPIQAPVALSLVLGKKTLVGRPRNGSNTNKHSQHVERLLAVDDVGKR